MMGLNGILPGEWQLNRFGSGQSRYCRSEVQRGAGIGQILIWTGSILRPIFQAELFDIKTGFQFLFYHETRLYVRSDRNP
jgi:hypothetical protein